MEICLGVHSFRSRFLFVRLFFRFIFGLVLLLGSSTYKTAEEGNSLSAWSVSLIEISERITKLPPPLLQPSKAYTAPKVTEEFPGSSNLGIV
jgi:hypothetical protein